MCKEFTYSAYSFIGRDIVTSKVRWFSCGSTSLVAFQGLGFHINRNEVCSARIV